MSLIEGIGDEVLLCFAVAVFVGLLSFVWFSTHVRPLWNGGTVYVVQVDDGSRNRRVLQVVSIDDPSALRQENLAADQSPTTQTAVSSSDSVVSTADIVDASVNDSVVTAAEVVEPSTAVANDISPPNSSNSQVNLPAASSTNQETSRDQQQQTTIKLKFFDDTHKMVVAWLTQTVGDFKRQNFQQETSRGQAVRLIYRGQMLRDDGKTLASYGLHENCVLHCHVTPTNGNSSNAIGEGQSASSNGGGGVGNNAGNGSSGSARPGIRGGPGRYICLVFGVKFCVLWSVLILYPQYFSFTSIFYLIFYTVIFGLFVYNSYFRRVPPAAGDVTANQIAGT